MSEANKQTARRFLDAMCVADAAGQAAVMTEDAWTVTHGFGQVSGQRDRATMLATVEAFRDIVPNGFNQTVHRVIAEGDTVMIEWEGDAVLSNGEPYSNQYVFVFTFRDGLICKLDEYFCTVLADKAILPLLAEKSAQMAHGV